MYGVCILCVCIVECVYIMCLYVYFMWVCVYIACEFIICMYVYVLYMMGYEHHQPICRGHSTSWPGVQSCDLTVFICTSLGLVCYQYI